MPRPLRNLLGPITLALASSVFFAPIVATADTLKGTLSKLLVEKADAVEVRLGRGHAELIVRRTVYNDGPRSDQAVFLLDMPEGAVATGLRTLGLKDGKPFWFDAELTESGAAAEKYAELTSMDGATPKDPALLSWWDSSHLQLQIFPVPSKEQRMVEYTLEIPTVYDHGRDRLDLQDLGTAELPAAVVVHPMDPSDGLIVADKPVGEEIALTIKDLVKLELARHDPPRFGGALAMVPFADKRALVRQRMEVARRVSEVPRGAGVVIVIDASRSLTDAELTSEIAAARAYLSHFEDARVEVLTFDRDVRAQHGRLVSVKRALRDLDAIPIERGNGSHVDDALARAGALLASLPSRAERRVVVFTDTRTREALSPERLRAAIADTRALVHVATIEARFDELRDTPSYVPSLQRDDDHDWADAVRATGGLVWQGGASAREEDADAMRSVYEELARPLRIDKLRWEFPGVAPDDLRFPETLAEGEGIVDLRITKLRVGWVKAEGELWSKPIQSVLLPDENESKLWSALVFGAVIDQGGDLGEPEMMTLAKRGGAVSPVTSYLAVAPGVRPSNGEFFGSSGGSSGGGGGFGSGHSSIGCSGARPSPEPILREALRRGFSACGGATHSATVVLETTLREVVDVMRVDVDDAGSGALAACLRGVAWDLDLPDEFSQTSDTFTVDL